MALVLTALPAAAGDDKRAAILARALSYDYGLKGRAGDSLTVAVLYRPGNSVSESSADVLFRLFKALEGVKVQGLSLGVTKLAYDGAEKFRAVTGMQGIDVVVVPDGMDGEVAAIREICRDKKLLSVGEKMSFLEAGLTLGVIDVDGKLTIVVNLTAAPLESVSFSSELLKLAKVIR
jgi:hypothetical protein